MFSKARVISTLGNRAAHSHRAIPTEDALAAVRELFHVAYWFGRTYGRVARPAPGLVFDANALPTAAAAPKQTAEQLQQLEAGLRECDEKLAALLVDKSALDEKLTRLRAEVAAARKTAAAQPDAHDYSEAETRDYFISDDQTETDRLTNALSAVPAAEQCGWLEDRYGLSWQIVPRRRRGHGALVQRRRDALNPTTNGGGRWRAPPRRRLLAGATGPRCTRRRRGGALQGPGNSTVAQQLAGGRSCTAVVGGDPR